MPANPSGAGSGSGTSGGRTQRYLQFWRGIVRDVERAAGLRGGEPGFAGGEYRQLADAFVGEFVGRPRDRSMPAEGPDSAQFQDAASHHGAEDAERGGAPRGDAG